MKNRDTFENTTSVRAKMHKRIHESDKAFDESMVSLMAWLMRAIQENFLSREEVDKIFKEELKARRDYDCLENS